MATIKDAALWFERRASQTPMAGARAMFGLAADALNKKAEREAKPMTNADKIRAMSDEELVDRIYQLNTPNAEGGDFSLLFCDGKANCIDSDGTVHCCEEREKACILRWLRQIAEE